jgi:hypothetical protein
MNMESPGHRQEKLLLGQLLIRQRLISEEQLAAAIAHQKETGKRLGEILASWNLLTHEHIQRALTRQRKLRLIAAFATALFAPLEALASVSMPPVENSVQAPAIDTTMRALSDDDLDVVSAAGLPDIVLRRDSGKSKGSGIDQLRNLAAIVNPVLNFLDADTTIKDVAYDPANAKATVNPDGSITMSMPSTIGEISFEHIRVKGDKSGASFGSISLKNIDLTGTTITLSVKK